MLAGDGKDFVGDFKQAAAGQALIGSILLERAAGTSGKAGSLQQTFHFLNTAPTEIVDHLAGDPHQQIRISSLEQVEDDDPLALPDSLGLQLLLKDLLQLLVKDVEAQLFGDGVDELALLFQERPFVGARPFLGVVNTDAANSLVLNDDVGALNPGGFLETR